MLSRLTPGDKNRLMVMCFLFLNSWVAWVGKFLILPQKRSKMEDDYVGDNLHFKYIPWLLNTTNEMIAIHRLFYSSFFFRCYSMLPSSPCKHPRNENRKAKQILNLTANWKLKCFSADGLHTHRFLEEKNVRCCALCCILCIFRFNFN